jgi:cell wall-associated NlpC family hydrolase
MSWATIACDFLFFITKMPFPLKICSAIAGSLLGMLGLAWAGPISETAHEATDTELAPSWSPPVAESLSQGMNIVSEANKYLGTPYRWGGTSPQTGFDCSGFVQFIFRHALHVKLPRLPVDMSRLGQRISREDLEPGDLVFFNTRGGSFTHVGIYVSDSQFIHAPRPRTRVTVSRMDSSYYRHRFTHAVRIRTD